MFIFVLSNYFEKAHTCTSARKKAFYCVSYLESKHSYISTTLMCQSMSIFSFHYIPKFFKDTLKK